MQQQRRQGPRSLELTYKWKEVTDKGQTNTKDNLGGEINFAKEMKQGGLIGGELGQRKVRGFEDVAFELVSKACRRTRQAESRGKVFRWREY